MRRERLILRVIKRSNLKLAQNLPVKSIDIIGDIAILKLPEELQVRSRFAEALLEEAPSIRVIYRQTSQVAGDYRLRELEWLAGERRSFTTCREHGCQIEVDVEKDYFSPRLVYERTRIAQQIKVDEQRTSFGEVIVNMFAGVGTFSLRIAKETRLSKIYSIDLNADAFLRMFRNVLSNKMLGRIVCIFGDAAQIIHDVLRSKADRVLMPLPEKSLQYLDSAIKALKPAGGIINFQGFVYAGKGANPVERSKSQVQTALENMGYEHVVESSRVIRSVGPGWYQIAHDIRIASSPAR